MNYYQHKQTGELLGSINNLRDFIREGQRAEVLTEVIRPNKLLGAGIISELMTYVEIRKNYRRISKKKALQICPDFGQMRHVDEKVNTSVHRMVIDLQDLLNIRGMGRGIAFTKEGKKKLEKYFEQN